MRQAIEMEGLSQRWRSWVGPASLALSIIASGCSDGTMDKTIVTPPGAKPPDESPVKPNVTPSKSSAKVEPI